VPQATIQFSACWGSKPKFPGTKCSGCQEGPKRKVICGTGVDKDGNPVSQRGESCEWGGWIVHDTTSSFKEILEMIDVNKVKETFSRRFLSSVQVHDECRVCGVKKADCLAGRFNCCSGQVVVGWNGPPIPEFLNSLPLNDTNFLQRIILWINEKWEKTVELVNKSVGECKDEIEELDKRFAIQESEVYQCTNFSKNIFPGVVDSRFELLSKELDITKTQLASTTSDYKSLQKQMDNQQQEIETLKQMFNTLSLSQSKQVPHSRCSTGLGFEHTVMGFESYNPFD
jgi:hypothetical protein